jgi:putative PIN family toxin of toxin-antitoxin system
VIDAVLDTNVLSSGIVGEDQPTSTPGELFRRWERRRFTLVLSEHILAELERTLTKPYFRTRLSPDRSGRALTSLRRRGRIVDPTAIVEGAATHPEDDLVLATVVSAGAPFLVTGDRQLLALGRFRGVAILSPSAFLAVLDRGNAAAP